MVQFSPKPHFETEKSRGFSRHLAEKREKIPLKVKTFSRSYSPAQKFHMSSIVVLVGSSLANQIVFSSKCTNTSRAGTCTWELPSPKQNNETKRRNKTTQHNTKQNKTKQHNNAKV